MDMDAWSYGCVCGPLRAGGYILASSWYRESIAKDLVNPTTEELEGLKQASCANVLSEKLGFLLKEATSAHLNTWRAAQIERQRLSTCTTDGALPTATGAASSRRRKLLGGGGSEGGEGGG